MYVIGYNHQIDPHKSFQLNYSWTMSMIQKNFVARSRIIDEGRKKKFAKNYALNLDSKIIYYIYRLTIYICVIIADFIMINSCHFKKYVHMKLYLNIILASYSIL